MKESLYHLSHSPSGFEVRPPSLFCLQSVGSAAGADGRSLKQSVPESFIQFFMPDFSG